jgi:hypothetical protein
MSSTKKVKKVYSLRVDGTEILSVEIETIDGLPPIRLNTNWLKKLANGQLSQVLNGNRSGNGDGDGNGDGAITKGNGNGNGNGNGTGKRVNKPASSPVKSRQERQVEK